MNMFAINMRDFSDPASKRLKKYQKHQHQLWSACLQQSHVISNFISCTVVRSEEFALLTIWLVVRTTKTVNAHNVMTILK